ncbi:MULTISPECIES: hypothetical protein [unclassified Lysobacter]|uniref:hypothetical protein n=1 Tax=unclassified Lysobacter TaxID=2635362 RepID=UPI001C22D17C|nr:hypothetical protein [Lysobacter sp. MMG2]MBU8975906.1 hypothetical protein [Lysobacter sp. MMG2]
MADRKPHKTLSFKQLVAKVHQAEDVLEERERTVAADLGQLKSSWLAAWTPWRIVTAGLVSGFVVGRAEPLRAIGKSGGLMQMVSMVASLVAGGSAKVAAEEATEANEQVQAEAAETSATGAGFAQRAVPPDAVAPPGEVDEALALAQAELRMRAARTATVDQVAP